MFYFVFNRSGSSECLCGSFFPYGSKRRSSVHCVCILLDKSHSSLLLEHSLTADGRPGSLSHHLTSNRVNTYRSELSQLAVPYLLFRILHLTGINPPFFFFEHKCTFN